MADQSQPRVGVGVMVKKDDKFLMGKRKGSHAAGQYASPGGHLDHMESFAACARREVKEETGIEITNIRFVCLVNLTDYAPKHYCHVQLLADWKSGEPKVMEPDKSEDWDWYGLDALPSPLFLTNKQFFESYRTGRAFWDTE